MRISDWSSDWCSSDLDNDSAGLAQAFDRDGVLFGSIPLKITQRPKGKPFNGDMLLDGHRYAVERPQWLAGPDGCIGIFRLFPCPLVIHGAEGMKHRVEGLDPTQKMLDRKSTRLNSSH